jgi:enoyl-CoA hydratase/3-hydroxyacyl-CoA dehydrogenase
MEKVNIGILSDSPRIAGLLTMFLLLGNRVFIYNKHGEVNSIIQGLKKYMRRWKVSSIDDLSEDIRKNIILVDDVERLAGESNIILESMNIDSKDKRSILSELCGLNTIILSEVLYPIKVEIKNLNNVLGYRFPIFPVRSNLIILIKHSYVPASTLDYVVEIFSRFGFQMRIVESKNIYIPLDRVLFRFLAEYLRFVSEGFDSRLLDRIVCDKLGLPYNIRDLILLFTTRYLNIILLEYDNHGMPLRLASDLVFHEKDFYLDEKNLDMYSEDIVNNFDILDILAPTVNESLDIVLENTYTYSEIDDYIKQVYMFPKGIFRFADEYGLKNIVKKLSAMHEITGWKGYKPNEILNKMLDKGQLGMICGRGFYDWDYKEATYGPVKYFKCHDVSFIVLSRKERLNALNEEMWGGIREALDKAESDGVRCVIIRGSEGVFSSGDDIYVMRSWRGIGDAEEFFRRWASPLVYKLSSMKIPVVTVIDGIAFGGGMELLILSDIVISTKRSVFSIPEVLIGALPPIASSLGLLLLGRRVTRYALTGEWINAYRARDIGLVDIVVDKDVLENIIVEISDKIRRASPRGIEATKSLINRLRGIVLPYLNSSLQELVNLSSTEDFIEGMNAFIEKRRPKWSEE